MSDLPTNDLMVVYRNLVIDHDPDPLEVVAHVYKTTVDRVRKIVNRELLLTPGRDLMSWRPR